MKVDSPDHMIHVPQIKCEILDLIREDRELIDRLGITTEEFEALSKCAMYGTLTCKEHMLAILRQIREAGDHAVDQIPLFAEPSLPAHPEEDPVPPECRRIVLRLNGAGAPELGLVGGAGRRAISGRLGLLFWGGVLVVGLVWGFVVAMSHWRNQFVTGGAKHVAALGGWYTTFDRLNFHDLLWGELLFVVGVVGVMYLITNRGSRRFKVNPRRSWR